MNATRRKSIEGAKAILEEVRDEEQAAYDNVPESLQESEAAEKMRTSIDALDEAIGALESIE